MTQTIRLQDIYSADLYTRSRASELRASISPDADQVTLDFKGIGFMSRSFADELCNIMDDLKTVRFHFLNRTADIEAMMQKVSEGRNRERKRGVGNAKMYEFTDMEKISEFLLAM